MQTLGTSENPRKHDNKRVCKTCDFVTSHLGDWNKHLLTGKHIKLTNASSGKQECACGKLFNHKQSLFRHKKHCEMINDPTAKNPKNPECFQMFPETQIKHERKCGRTYNILIVTKMLYIVLRIIYVFMSVRNYQCVCCGVSP